MNAEPLIPLPTKNTDKPLNIRQLMGLWFIWCISIAAGILVLLCELMVGILAEHTKYTQIKKGTKVEKIQKKIRAWAAQNNIISEC